jgi:hypothetical protein
MQVEKRFGNQANFLVDFYHVSEYLAAASELLGESKKRAWLKQQQRRLKANKTSEVIKEITKLEGIEKLKLASVAERTLATKEEQPASTCNRYLENRLEYLTTNSVKGRLSSVWRN